MKSRKMYKERKYIVKNIFSDRESGLLALISEVPLPGVIFNPCGAGEHVPSIEATNRGLKMIVRSIIAGLPYKLPKRLMRHIVSAATNIMNWRPCEKFTDAVSPKELLLNRKMSVKLDLRGRFGDYIEVYVTNGISNSVTQARTEPGILLYPAGNFQGG